MCNCGNKKRETWIITTPGGLRVTRTSKAAADSFAAKHPGSTVTQKK